MADAFADLPGGELVSVGLADLHAGRESIEALLVAIGAPRLRELGLAVPAHDLPSPERRLYDLLAADDPDSAHGRYNALLRRLVSFERALALVARQLVRAAADAARIGRFMSELGRAASSPARVYFTGGVTAVLLGWRASTIDADIHLVPDSDALLRAIPRLKEELQLNVELACPADFIPELPGWRERSRFIGDEARVSFFHYDFYAQALSKIERGHAQDRDDVGRMLADGLVEPAMLRRMFDAIRPQLHRYPAVDPGHFQRALEGALAGC